MAGSVIVPGGRTAKCEVRHFFLPGLVVFRATERGLERQESDKSFASGLARGPVAKMGNYKGL
jgi:hypothetical protein